MTRPSSISTGRGSSARASRRPHWPALAAISLLILSLVGTLVFVPQAASHPWLALIAVLLLILSIGGTIILVPQIGRNLVPHPNPAGSYTEAVRRIQDLRAAESTGFNPVCRVQFMTHDQKTARVVVMAHGYTSCPEGFRPLGEQFYVLGYNVLIAPLPHHGLDSRMTGEHSLLTAEEVVEYADTVLDIARGLGDYIIMMGLSGGGVTTAWAAQFRSDLDLAVVISPAFGYYALATRWTAAAAVYYLTVPNAYNWWDNDLKEKNPPDYGYPRYATRALAQFLRVGLAVQVRARRAPPAARAIVVVTNANDRSINNALTKIVAGNWRDHGANLRSFEFGADLNLGHDLIDPNQPGQRIDIVYPQLIKLVTQSGG